jgi:rhodanese-related sulfurtransferase
MEQIMSLPKINAEEAKRQIDQGAVLIDIRSLQEHARERIPGAHNRPLGPGMNLEPSGPGPIVFHCKSGQRTAANAASLAQLANCEAYILDGGIDAWNRAGLPVKGNNVRPTAGVSGWRGIAKALGVMSPNRRTPVANKS